MKKLFVWQDINSCDSAWNSEEDLKDLKPAICTTIGYLYEENETSLKLCTYSLN
jgi:hypothetical protein